MILADAMPRDGWMAIGVFALFSIAWLLTLVPFATALLNGSITPRIAAAHVIAWAGLIAGASWLTGFSASPTKDLVFIIALLAGIGATEAAVLWFINALIKARERALARPAIAPCPSVPGAVESNPAPAKLSRDPGLIPTLIAVVLLAYFTQRSPKIIAVSNAIHAWQGVALKILIPLTAAGFIGFFAGTIRFVLAEGTPMTKEEIEQLSAQTKLIGRPYWKGGFKYRIYGEAVGMQGGQQLTFTEIKAAWKSGDWYRDRHWQIVFQITISALLMIFAGLAIAFVCAPAAVQILTAAALVYCALRLTSIWIHA